MKVCETCHEDFADQFSFCPVDGSPLSVCSGNPTKMEKVDLGGQSATTNLTAKTDLADWSRLRELPKRGRVPQVSPDLDDRVWKSYLQTIAQLHVMSSEADIQLRKSVALSLVGVFSFTVLLTGLIIILMGLDLIKLPSEVIHV